MKLTDITTLERTTLEGTDHIRVSTGGVVDGATVESFQTAIANLLTPEEIEACKNPALLIKKDPVIE